MRSGAEYKPREVMETGKLNLSGKNILGKLAILIKLIKIQIKLAFMSKIMIQNNKSVFVTL